jgi:hypothetical protein
MAKSLPHGKLGNLNMRGKRTHALSCGCCVCEDVKRREQEKRMDREMHEEAALCPPAQPEAHDDE